MHRQLREELETVRSRLETVETQYRVAAGRFDEIERINQLSYAFQDRMEEIELKQNQLVRAVQELDRKLAVADSRPAGSRDAQQPNNPGRGDAVPESVASEFERDAPKVTVGKDETVQEVYSRAYRFLQDERFSEAETLFNYVLATWGKDDLADNALYWLGEVQYARKRWMDALRIFESVAKRFPLGNKVPDAMLKQALCWEKLGDALKSKQVADQLRTSYPWTPAAEKAASLENHAGGKE